MSTAIGSPRLASARPGSPRLASAPLGLPRLPSAPLGSPRPPSAPPQPAIFVCVLISEIYTGGCLTRSCLSLVGPLKHLMRTAAVRWIQNRRLHPEPPVKFLTSTRRNSMCLEAAAAVNTCRHAISIKTQVFSARGRIWRLVCACQG